MFWTGFFIGAVIAGVAVGELAHRRPEWFSKVVKVVNDGIDKVK